ncbi:MAG: hypothetical protein IJ165_05035, partial [Proteobacteria bacterium]|nr:hypothetical protein [Pseudomonadota bacterium]
GRLARTKLKPPGDAGVSPAQNLNRLGMRASRPHKTYVPEILLSKSQQLFRPSLKKIRTPFIITYEKERND